MSNVAGYLRYTKLQSIKLINPITLIPSYLLIRDSEGVLTKTPSSSLQEITRRGMDNSNTQYHFLLYRDSEGVLTKAPSSSLQEIARRGMDNSNTQYQSPMEGFFLAGVKLEDQMASARSRSKSVTSAGSRPGSAMEKMKVSNKREYSGSLMVGCQW